MSNKKMIDATIELYGKEVTTLMQDLNRIQHRLEESILGMWDKLTPAEQTYIAEEIEKISNKVTLS